MSISDYVAGLSFDALKALVRNINEIILTEDNYIKLNQKKTILQSLSIELLTKFDKYCLGLIEKGNTDTGVISSVNKLYLPLSKAALNIKKEDIPQEKILNFTEKDTSTHPKKNVSRKNVYPISANSPNLIRQFSRIGYTDQNGTSHYGSEAILVLQHLWNLDEKEYPDIAPSLDVKSNLYELQATVTVAPVTEEIQVMRNGILSTQNRPQYVQTKPTIFENGNSNCKVLAQGFNGNAIKFVQTRPLFIGNKFQINNVVSVDWHIGKDWKKESKKRQRKEKIDYYKKVVKSKISWGTRHIAADLSGVQALGNTIYLPDTNKNDSKSTQYRLVLESNRVKLYRVQDNSLYGVIGSFKSTFYPKASEYTIDIQINKDFYENTPHWVTPLSEGVEKILTSLSKSKNESLEKSILASQWDKITLEATKKLSKNAFNKLKKQSRKAVFTQYKKGVALPLDVKLACEKLQYSKTLTDKQRAYYNRLLIGYYKSDMGADNIVEINQMIKPKAPKKVVKR